MAAKRASFLYWEYFPEKLRHILRKIISVFIPAQPDAAPGMWQRYKR